MADGVPGQEKGVGPNEDALGMGPWICIGVVYMYISARGTGVYLFSFFANLFTLLVDFRACILRP